MGDELMFKHILGRQTMILWRWGPVTQYMIDLSGVDSSAGVQATGVQTTMTHWSSAMDLVGSMDATEKTYANCQAVITEKDATIDALHEERDQFQKALEQQLLTYKELQDKQMALLNKHMLLHNAHKILKANVQDVVELNKASCGTLKSALEDSDSDLN